MDAVTNIVLSAVVSLTTTFNDGLKAVEQKDFDKAVTALSKVVDDKSETNPLKPLALFYRAQSYWGRKDAKSARADILSLLELVDEGALSQNALALMKETGGGDKELEPRESPERVWSGFIDDATAGRLDEARRRSTGEWLGTVSGWARNDECGRMFADQMRKFQVVELRIGEDKDKGKAWLSVTHADQPGQNMDVEFVKVRNKWMISGWGNSSNGRGRKAGGERSNFARLRVIANALNSYARAHSGAFPPRFDDLIGQHVKDAGALMWQDAAGAAGAPFLYCAGLTNSADGTEVVVAEPVASDGRRDVICSNGRVMKISEDEFKKAAAAQKWDIPEKPGVARVTQATIDGLVERLRKGGTTERKKVRKDLYDLRVDAYQLLEKYRNDEDPEVQETMREIFGKK